MTACGTFGGMWGPVRIYCTATTTSCGAVHLTFCELPVKAIMGCKIILQYQINFSLINNILLLIWIAKMFCLFVCYFTCIICVAFSVGVIIDVFNVWRFFRPLWIIWRIWNRPTSCQSFERSRRTFYTYKFK